MISKRCKICGGDLIHFGKLGTLNHYKCRHCGMMFSKESKLTKTRRTD